MDARRHGLRFLACGAGGVLLALPLQLWMHKALPGWPAVGLGLVAGGLPPLILAPAWGDLPRFLGRGLDAAVAAIGVLAVTLGTVALRGPLYALLRRDELIAGTMAVALLSVGVASLVETHRRLAAVIARREQELAESRRAAVEAQLRALRAQIRPHFLFNTFNALSELIHQDADAAEELVTDLAHLLRYSLSASADGDVMLADELATIQRYLRIEKARLGSRLRVDVAVPDELGSISVPGLVLQPLVENAVQHAIAVRPEGGVLRIGGARVGATLVLTVDDDGPGIPAAVVAGTAEGVGTAGHGGGFANVRRRLALRFGDDATLQARSGDGGTTVELRLPISTAGEETT